MELDHEVLAVDEVLDELSERGRIEWELATNKALLKKARQRIQDLGVEKVQLLDQIDNMVNEQGKK